MMETKVGSGKIDLLVSIPKKDAFLMVKSLTRFMKVIGDVG